MDTMQGIVDTKAPVRAGDVFDYADTGRAATVMRTLPGGRAELRIEGFIAGRRSLRLSDATVRELKQWKRLGRAEYQDGCYYSVLHLARGVES